MALSTEKVFSGNPDGNKNTIIIDPNKVVVDDVTLHRKYVKDRYVKQEDLVMYAGLKAYSRGRNSIYEDGEETTVTTDFGEIMVNFLNPTKDEKSFKNFFTTQWTDTFTDQRASDNRIDPETFGIKTIEITQNASLVPRIVIEFIDVRGKTLMEQGDNDSNPYNLFYSIPYPSFMLTIKGYYGKAITYPLVLLKTNTRFDPGSGDYYIRCEFLSRTFAIFNDFVLAYGIAAPYMFKIDKKDKDGFDYEGMYILDQLYKKQNEFIKVEMERDRGNLSDAELQKRISRRMINKAITIPDLIRSVRDLNTEDLTHSDDPDKKEILEARSILDFFRSGLEESINAIHLFFEPGAQVDFEIINQVLYFKDKSITDDPVLLTHQINDINNTYEDLIGKSENKKIKEFDTTLTTLVKSKGFLKDRGVLLNIKTFEINVNGRKGYELKRFNSFVELVENTITSAYKVVADEVIDIQRESIQEKLKFDITLENVIRIFMNNMQTFLMLLNLTSKKALYQIQNDDQRKSSQIRDAEHKIKDGKTVMYPWPNFYKKDQTDDKTDELYRRIYPGYKLSNKNWPEVNFVEELFSAFQRVSESTNPAAEKQKKYTALMTPFLNSVSNEQYMNFDVISTSEEIIKKAVLSIFHDGVHFKTPNTETLQILAEGLTKFDHLIMTQKVKQFSSQKSVLEIEKIKQFLFDGSDEKIVDNLFNKFKANVDLPKLKAKIKSENDAFFKHDRAGMKIITDSFYNKNGVNYMKEPNSVVTTVYNHLIKEKNPLIYSVPPGSNSIERNSDFKLAKNNNDYESLPFPNFTKENKILLNDDKGDGLNIVYGFENASPYSIAPFDYNITSNQNLKINGTTVLTFTNKIAETTEVDNSLAKKYNKV